MKLRHASEIDGDEKANTQARRDHHAAPHSIIEDLLKYCSSWCKSQLWRSVDTLTQRGRPIAVTVSSLINIQSQSHQINFLSENQRRYLERLHLQQQVWMFLWDIFKSSEYFSSSGNNVRLKTDEPGPFTFYAVPSFNPNSSKCPCCKRFA